MEFADLKHMRRHEFSFPDVRTTPHAGNSYKNLGCIRITSAKLYKKTRVP